MRRRDEAVRLATAADAATIARLLHDFNLEFSTPSPGARVLEPRVRELLSGSETFAVLAREPAAGIALVTLRPNVWYAGPVALLDEMYVRPDARGGGLGGLILARMIDEARSRGVDLVEINVDEGDRDALRFYERHGFTSIEPTTGERAWYVRREL